MIKPPHLGGLVESRESDGNLSISDYWLCELEPPKEQLMPNQIRNWCGCEISILAI